MTTKHKPETPLPWIVRHHKDAHVYGPNMRNIYTATDNMPPLAEKVTVQDAAYIAHVCNAYPKLVEVLRHINEHMAHVAKGHGIFQLAVESVRDESAKILHELRECK